MAMCSEEAGPPAANTILPAFASSTSSLSVLIDDELCTTSTIGVAASWQTGSKLPSTV